MKKYLLKITTLLLLAMLWVSTALMAQNMDRYITLTVTDGADIELALAADADDTPVQIVSGGNTYDITVGTAGTGNQVYTAGATTMTIYGDIKKFYCSDNGADITALDVSHNTALVELYCSDNQLSSLDVSSNVALLDLECPNNQLSSLDVSNNAVLANLNCSSNQLSNLDVSNNVALEILYCYDNQLSSIDVSSNVALLDLECPNNQLNSLDVSNNPNLESLECSNNQLSSLDVSNNADLQILWCFNNQLSSLDVSSNAALRRIYCSDNQLSSLNVSDNSALDELWCHKNPLTTQVIDDIYCALADRTALAPGKVYLANSTSDANYAAILESNAQNARNKNWEVWYYDYDSDTGFGPLHDADIPTTGTYVCGAVAVTGISLEQSNISLVEGTTQQLTATVSPGNATNQTVTWSSQDESVATVDENGLVTGVALNGKTTITVTTEDGDFTATCEVEAYDAIEELSLSNIAKVYPNPVYETLYIEPQTTSDFTVELYNTHGQLVLQSQNNTTISVADLPKGIYMLKLTIDKQVYYSKYYCRVISFFTIFARYEARFPY